MSALESGSELAWLRRIHDKIPAGGGATERLHVPFTVTASGDNTVYTPAAGKSVRIHYITFINDPVALTSTVVRVKLGATEIYRAWALAKSQQKTGDVDAPLILNLSSAGNVAGTAILEEV